MISGSTSALHFSQIRAGLPSAAWSTSSAMQRNSVFFSEIGEIAICSSPSGSA